MMKSPLSLWAALLFTGAAFCFVSESNAADTSKKTDTAAASERPLKKQIAILMDKIQLKVDEDMKTEKDFADELKEFDAILKKHQGEKTDEVANVLVAKAQVYAEVLGDVTKAQEALKQLKTDFPDTKPGMNADRMATMIQRQAEAKKAQSQLAEGATFPDFDEKDLDGKPLSVANYKGKVVLVDFWATWCGPCVGEMPNVIKTYGKYHDKGFEIIGISLDQDKDALTAFIKDKNMAWPQFFDGQGWQNKLGVKYGIESIPANFLIGKDGKIIGSSLRGDELDAAVAKAIGG